LSGKPASVFKDFFINISMNFLDLFKPYSPAIRGDLKTYLTEHDGSGADNLFYGPKYFHIMKKNGIISPGITWIRVDRSPIPDIAYVINSNYDLESTGAGKLNMSLIGAEAGIYDPNKALKRKLWSIYNFNV
jgi:hypothetical protein